MNRCPDSAKTETGVSVCDVAALRACLLANGGDKSKVRLTFS